MLIMSIDPGTNSTGVSILSVDYPTVKVIFAETIKADRLMSNYSYIEQIHGSRYARIIATADRIAHLLTIYPIDAIVSESPYMGRFAQSFAALTELISEIRNRIFCFDNGLFLDTIDPSTVKKFMGVKGTSGDKDLMRKALNNKFLLYDDYLKPAEFDEHTVDSICVGLSYVDKITTHLTGPSNRQCI